MPQHEHQALVLCLAQQVVEVVQADEEAVRDGCGTGSQALAEAADIGAVVLAECPLATCRASEDEGSALLQTAGDLKSPRSQVDILLNVHRGEVAY